jgi:hypothetical protein
MAQLCKEAAGRRRSAIGPKNDRLLYGPGRSRQTSGPLRRGPKSERPIRCAAIRGGDPCEQSMVPPPVQPDRAEQCVLLSRYAVRRRPDLAVASTLPETETEGDEMAPRGLTAASWD